MLEREQEAARAAHEAAIADLSASGDATARTPSSKLEAEHTAAAELHAQLQAERASAAELHAQIDANARPQPTSLTARGGA